MSGGIARVLSLLLVVVPLSCGSASKDTEDAGAGAGGGSGGVAGATGTGGGAAAIGFSDASGGAPECAWPVKEPPSAAPELQPFCDGTGQNPTECPATPPQSGAACTTIGASCWYPDGDFLQKLTCINGYWQSASSTARCKEECGALTVGLAVDVPAVACGSVEPSPCADVSQTNTERLTATLQAISQCCGVVNEGSIEIELQDGCATKVISDRDLYPNVLHCYAVALAGRKLSCAASLACGLVQWSLPL